MSRLFRPFLLGVLFILPLMACTLTTTAPVSATPSAPPVQIVTATKRTTCSDRHGHAWTSNRNSDGYRNSITAHPTPSDQHPAV